MDNLYSKLIKVASYLDKNGYHKECDQIEKHLSKIAALAIPGELSQLPKAGKGILDIIKSIPKFKIPKFPTAPRLPKLPSDNYKPAPTGPSRPGRTTLPDVRERPSIIWDTPPETYPPIIWDTPPLETPPLEIVPPRDPSRATPFPLPDLPDSPVTPDLPDIRRPDRLPIIEPEPDLIPDNPVIPTPRPRPRPRPIPLPPPLDDVRPLPPGRQNPNPTPLPPGRQNPNPTPLPPGRPNPNPQPPGKPNPPGQKPPNKPPTDNPKKPPKFPFVPIPIMFSGKKEDAGELYYEGDTSSKDT